MFTGNGHFIFERATEIVCTTGRTEEGSFFTHFLIFHREVDNSSNSPAPAALLCRRAAVTSAI